MMETSESSSEEDFDQEELEAALYSQTHFDANSNAEFLAERQEKPFAIKIYELPARAAHTLPKQSHSLSLGEFIAFSSDKDSNFHAGETKKICSEQSVALNISTLIDSANIEKVKKEPQFVSANKEKSLNIFCGQRREALPEGFPYVKDEKFQFGEEKMGLANIQESHYLPDLNESKTKPSQNKNIHEAGQMKQENTLIVSIDSDENLFENDFLEIPSTSGVSSKREVGNKLSTLPFQITKKGKNQNMEKPQVVVIHDDEHEETSNHELKQQVISKSKGKRKRTKDVPKIQDFLELTKSFSSERSNSKLISQKFMTKSEAAVKPRKPEVQVRRPPPAIPVRYRLDSDTATDYSDSDTSCMNTPIKIRKEKQDINGSQNIIPVKVNQSSDDESDKEELAGSENVQVFESKEKPVKESSISCHVNKSGSESTSGIKEEDDSDDSDFSACVLVGDTPVEFLPNLDFNLAGGVSKLLSGENSAKPSPQEDLWKIDEKDRYKDKSTTSRYFALRPIQCRNCRKNGHLSRDCPEPLRQRCIFCSEEGHQFKTCPKTVCYNCGAVGHRNSDCKEPKMDWNTPCGRCWMKGCREEVCPDKWRQLHLSLHVGKLHLRSNHRDRIDFDEKRNTRVYCYNCGKNGHWGYECWLPRMNRFVAPSYPFVAHYDRKSEIVSTMLPDGVSIEDVRKDAQLEREMRRLEKKICKQDKHMKEAAKKRDKVSKELVKRRQSQENLPYYVSEEKSLKDATRKAHDQQERVQTSYQEQDIRSASRKRSEYQAHRNSKNMKIPLSSMDQLRPSTSKSAQRLRVPAFSITVPSPRLLKSRKRQRHAASPEVDSGDSYEDMVQHQVGSNEWWLDTPDRSVRQRKNREIRRSNEVHLHQQRSPPYLVGEPVLESRHQIWSDELNDLKANPSLVSSPFKRQHTTFVYVDEQLPSYTHHSHDRLDHTDNPPFQQPPVHHLLKHSKHQQFWETDGSPPKAAKSAKHSRSHRSKHRGRESHLNRYHDVDQNSHSSRSKAHPKRLKHNYSASWPSAQEKKRNAARSATLNRGFQSRHERFVTMKNDCDIKVSMRK